MKTFATLLAGAAVAAAAPSVSLDEAKSSGSFSLPAIRNEAFKPNGPLALAKAYKKYGKPMPNDLEAALESLFGISKRKATGELAARATGSATNTPTQYDSEYLTPVKIGTPAQTLNLDFDTGSSDLWVFSTETPANSVNGQTLYSPSKSSTARKLSGATWQISYGDGSSSSGDVYTDVVSVGGLSVKGQAVESAQTVSSSFTGDSASSGLLGLAFSSINTVTPNQQTTFFDTAMSSLTSPVFTADLKYQANGKYNFGYIDSSAYTGSITYTSVDNSQGFWQTTFSGYGVGSGSLKKTSFTGIADTGTTLLLLDDTIVNAYYAKVSGAQYDSQQGGYTFDCGTTLPSFTFGVGSSSIVVPGTYLNYAPTDQSGQTCFGGLQSDSGIGFSIVGDVGLKAAFVVFDGGNTRLGWARKTLS